MKSPVFPSADSMPRSNGKHPDHQICDAKHSENKIPIAERPSEQIFDLGFDDVGMGKGFSKVNERVTLNEGLIESRVISGEGLIGSNSSIAPMAEAPVTPLTQRECGRRCSLTSLTPLTTVSSHSSSNNGDCCNEWSEKVEEKACSSVEDTPEHNAFDPFASHPDELGFAPKKSFKAKSVFANDCSDGEVDSLDASKKPASAKTHCKIRASRPRVARVLCFDEEDEIDGVGCNAHTGPSLDKHGSAKFYRSEQLQKEPSKVIRALDLDYNKHSSVNGSSKLLNSPREDVLVEESFVETMCRSFLQAILAKHYEDADIDHNNTEDNLSDQSAPSTPVETKAFVSTVDCCPGAPMKEKSKPRTRGADFSSVCRKIEF